MATIDVIMPQMGESIAEGTLSRWIKKVGEAVKRDEPIFEISTDKVDAEIPAPSARGAQPRSWCRKGRRSRCRPSSRGSTPRRPPAPRSRPRRAGSGGLRTRARARAAPSRRHRRPSRLPPPPKPTPAPPPPAPAARPAAEKARAGHVAEGNGEMETAEERLRRRSTPLVRKMAAEHNLDISEIPGTGLAGRVTKNDVLGYIEGGQRVAPPAPDVRLARRPPAPEPAGARARARLPRQRGSVGRRHGRAVEPDPQAHGRAHGDVAAGLAAREHHLRDRLHPDRAAPRPGRRRSTPTRGVNLTFLAFIAKATADALRRHPSAQRRGLGREHDPPPRHQPRHRGRARLGAHRSGHQARRRAVAARTRAGDQRSRRAGPGQEAEPRRGAEGYLHHHQSRRVRLGDRHADHQPAAGGDPLRRLDREAARRHHGGRHRHDRRCGPRACCRSRSTTGSWTAPTPTGSWPT